MTDNEIIKALECCVKGLECKNCPANPHKGNYGYCTSLLLKDALDLINRQQAEIERLTAERDAMHQDVIAAEEYAWQCKTAKAESIKEFAERLKEKYLDDEKIVNMAWVNAIEHIDNLLKELVGDNCGV